MKRLLLAATTLLALSVSANATQTFCAVVLKNPDGWLALREKPDWRGKLLHKLKEGVFLYAGTELCWEDACTDEKRQWTHIAGVPSIDGKGDGVTFGWVRSKYVQSFVCPEDQVQ